MPATTRFRRILHPSDFSEVSGAAFTQAVQFAKEHDAELLLLHVYALPIQMSGEYYIPPSDYAALERATRAAAKKHLDKLIARARWAGVRARGVLQEGIPHQRIADAARTNRADLIVMGTHGRTALARVFLGSVATRIVTSASCPVLTVRGG